MNYLLARIRDRRNGIRCVLSNQTIYALPTTLTTAIPYAPDDALEDDEWFFLDHFSEKGYFLEFLKRPINGTSYATILPDEFKQISFLCAIQNDPVYSTVYCFQRVSKTQLLQQNRIIFGETVKFEESSRQIVIGPFPDAVYCPEIDKLFFQRLPSITAIFPGIDEIFREATEQETTEFLASEFIVTGDNFNATCVKKANRKRIALAQEALRNYDDDQKAAVLESIRCYYPAIINDDNSFRIENDDDLTYLLYGIMQRYYTTADGREKRIASSIRKLN